MSAISGNGNGKAMLSVEGLHFAYDDLKVLWDVSITVNEGEIVTLVGSNGAGKSTTLKNISRLVKWSSGSVTFMGEDLARLEPHQVVERGVIHVPEGRRIFPEMTVTENLRMGSFPKGCHADREKNFERAFSLFPRLKERHKQLLADDHVKKAFLGM